MPTSARPDGADDAQGHGLVETEGIADGEHVFADVEFVGVAPGDRRQIPGADLDDREVGLGVGADDLAGELALVIEQHLDLVSLGDDVVVGDDVAVGRDDHAGTETVLAPLARHLKPLEKLLAEKLAK